VSEPWTAKATRLADSLVAAGKLRSPEWRAAVERTPRHIFVPDCYRLDPRTGEWNRHTLGGDAELDVVYSDAALFVLPDGLSSSSMPGLMTRMLEDLDMADDHRVLEIGTGSGYNAALLCHRLGDHHVFSVDLEPALVDRARQRLAALGHLPVLRAADGAAGMPDHGPFDRIIATCSVPRVPSAWIEQTAPGGRILLDLKIGKQAGNLVHLRPLGDGAAEGRFDPTYASFMAIRGRQAPPGALPVTDPQTERTSTLHLARPWENTVVWFLAALTMPTVTGFGLRAEPGSAALDTVTITTADGSRSEITAGVDGVRSVRERRPIWAHVEHAHAEWIALGRPGWDRIGLTVRAGRHTVWIDHPAGRSWTLPQRITAGVS
jgi:protein-L-isoaspartate(D-aspartate) O-methyltransferase